MLRRDSDRVNEWSGGVFLPIGATAVSPCAAMLSSEAATL
ncbi:hypothetical protein GGR40_002878 [Novosphingobium gossypii]